MCEVQKSSWIERKTGFTNTEAGIAALCLFAVLFVRMFLFAPMTIRGASMEPTLHTDEHYVMTKMGVILQPEDLKRGDIAIIEVDWNRLLAVTPKYEIFKIPIFENFGDRELFVKRVIGLPGEHVKILAGKVYINGQPLEEPYIHSAKYDLVTKKEDPSLKKTKIMTTKLTPQEYQMEYLLKYQDYEVQLKDDEFFILGDNRLDSMDSRSLGAIPAKRIYGRMIQ